MTTAAARTAVQAFICCRLDYCNSLLYGMSDGRFRIKIQSIQNAAARHRDSSMRSHLAGAASIALASCSSTTRLHVWCTSRYSGSDTCIPGWRRPTRDGHWSPSSAFSCRQDMLRPTDTEQFQRSKLQCGRPACVEQFATAPTTRHEPHFQIRSGATGGWRLLL